LIDQLVEHFSDFDDPRCPGKVEHRLIDILVIAVCAVIASAERRASKVRSYNGLLVHVVGRQAAAVWLLLTKAQSA